MARVFVGSVGTVLDAARAIIAQQNEVIRDLRTRERAVADLADAAKEDPEAIARAEAMIKISDAVVQYGIPALQRLSVNRPAGPGNGGAPV